MKTAIRWVAVCVIGAAAAGPYAAFAVSPASNGVGDGEANVPFAAAGGGADELDGDSVAPGQPRGYEVRKVAGRAGRSAGRPAYREDPADAPANAPAKTEADEEFLQRVWTAP